MMAAWSEAPPRKWCWLSSRAMTVAVATENGVIVAGAPIVRPFLGQPIGNLRHWMRKQGDFHEQQL